jgi:hypothetical protein
MIGSQNHRSSKAEVIDVRAMKEKSYEALGWDFTSVFSI